MSTANVPAGRTVPAGVTRIAAKTRAASRLSPNVRIVAIAISVRSVTTARRSSSRRRTVRNAVPPSSKVVTIVNSKRANIVGNILKFRRNAANSTRKSATASVVKSMRACMSSSAATTNNAKRRTSVGTTAITAIPTIAGSWERRSPDSLRKSRVRQARSSASLKPVPNVSMTIIVGPKARSMTNVPRMRNAMTVIRKSSVAAVANVTTSMQGSHAIAMRTSGKRHSARVDR